MMKVKDTQKGFSVLEIVLGVAIITVAFFGISSTARDMLRVSKDANRETQAGFLIEEGIEALRAARDYSWDSTIGFLPTETWFYIDPNGSVDGWISAVPYEIDETFTRRFMISTVNRDANDDIAEVGIPDPNTRKITLAVDWERSSGTVATRSVETYLTNLFDN